MIHIFTKGHQMLVKGQRAGLDVFATLTFTEDGQFVLEEAQLQEESVRALNV